MSFLNAAKKRKKFKPHDYQEESEKWLLSHLVSGLFLKAGLGKTSTTLSAFVTAKKAGHIDKMLVIAPLRVCQMVWPVEVEKWDITEGLSVGVLHGSGKNKILTEEHDIYVVNPSGLKWLLERVKDHSFSFTKINWWLVVDESSNFKNSRSMRFKQLKYMLNMFKRRTILTATPAPRNMENLWPQVFILDGGKRLGKYITQFRNKYFFPVGYMGYEYALKEGGKEEIFEAVDDIIMHKGDEELNLPERLDNYIFIDLPNTARKTYEEMKNEFVAEMNGEESLIAVNAAVASGKLRQISNGGIYAEDKKIIHIHDEKTNAVTELYDNLNGRPLMIMYEFNHDLERLRAAFPDAPALSGGISSKSAKKIIEDWNSDKLSVLLLHPAAAGHGLNLQESECRDVCWYSIPWDLEQYIQANARVHRQGVKHSVTVHHIVAKDTIDERIIKVLEKKGNMQDALLEALLK